jgi:succinate-semialdehyde dehydrogenase/glutarate-semialdehyde dehydrogenase
VFGGQRAPELGSDLYYRPTVVDNITADSLLNTEETFGPGCARDVVRRLR